MSLAFQVALPKGGDFFHAGGFQYLRLGGIKKRKYSAGRKATHCTPGYQMKMVSQTAESIAEAFCAPVQRFLGPRHK